MCGIGGILNFDFTNSVNIPLLRNISDSLKERGPDGCGEWVQNNIGFVHRRLSIIDPFLRSNQPMLDDEKKYVISFNGEIYNFKYLKKKLIDNGINFKTNSDTEVIINLFKIYGVQSFSQLRGMFSFSIYDIANRKLFLVRDPLGIKPLYYYKDNKCLIFSSLFESLNNLNLINKKLDSSSSLDFFLFGHLRQPNTTNLFIKSLEPGHYLEIDEQKMKKNKYLTLENIFNNENISLLATDSVNIKNLQSSIFDSVNAHTISDVNLGLFLSSGIDSSSIAGHLKNCDLNKKITSFTLKFPEFYNNKQNEDRESTNLASKFQFEHYNEIIDFDFFESNLNNFIASMDSPTIDGLNTWLISKKAKLTGNKVFISGIGADEIVDGYKTIQKVTYLVNMNKVYLSFFFEKFFKFFSKYVSFNKGQKLKKIYEYGNNYAKAYYLVRCLNFPENIRNFLEEDIISESINSFDFFENALLEMQNVKNNKLSLMHLDYKYYLQDQLLVDTDWASMSNSIEIRTPFVDKKLLEKVSKFVNCKNYLLSKRNIFDSSKNLPNSIMNRQKTGFGIPLNEWLNKLGIISSKNNTNIEWAKYIYKNKFNIS